jgi:hypothetical protein
MGDSEMIELLRHLPGSYRELGCKAAARIEELEAERDILEAELRVCYKLPFAMDHPVAQKLVAESDAIEAATIERACAAVASVLPSGGLLSACQRVIRALKPSPSAESLSE